MKFLRKKNKKINVKPTMQVITTKKKFIKPKEYRKNIFRLNTLVLISTLFIMIGLLCVSYNYIETKKELAFDTANRTIKPKTIAKAKPKKDQKTKVIHHITTLKRRKNELFCTTQKSQTETCNPNTSSPSTWGPPAAAPFSARSGTESSSSRN